MFQILRNNKIAEDIVDALIDDMMRRSGFDMFSEYVYEEDDAGNPGEFKRAWLSIVEFHLNESEGCF